MNVFRIALHGPGTGARLAAAALAISVLSACNGGSGTSVPGNSGFSSSGTPAPVGPSFGRDALGEATLSTSAYDGNAAPVSDASAGRITLPDGVITAGRLAGTLNAARTEIALDGGGTARLSNPMGTDYVRFLDLDGSESLSGVVGLRTASGDLPQDGRVSYVGRAELTAVDPEALYQFEGRAEVGVDFEASRVFVRVTGLEGERRQGTDIRDTRIDSIVISDSVLSGGVFTGGDPSVTGAPFPISAAADASDTEGALYGAGADEAAGRLVIRDPGGENVTIIGRFAAE